MRAPPRFGPLQWHILHFHTWSYMCQPYPAITNHQKLSKSSKNITSIHTPSQYPNIYQYNSIHPNISHYIPRRAQKKSEHTALSSSTGTIPSTAGTAGAAWVAMGCWHVLARHEMAWLVLVQKKTKKTNGVAIPWYSMHFQGLWK